MRVPMRKTCKVSGCRARAWQQDLCNLHALERYRSPRRDRPRAERLAEGKRLLRERARELGITLADDPDGRRSAARREVELDVAVDVAIAIAPRAVGKVRSPVG